MSDEPIHPSSPAKEQPEPACERCGRPDAVQFGDAWICDDCYAACGSCCAGDDE